MPFLDYVDIDLKLTIDGKVLAVESTQVQTVSMSVTPYGYRGKVAFWVSQQRTKKDEIYIPFTGKKLIEVALTITRPKGDSKSTPTPFAVLKGIVTNKTVNEQSFDRLTNNPVLFRRYEIEFFDPAVVTLSQHFPCDLHVDAAMKAIVDAHKTDKVTYTNDWAELTKTAPIHFVPLGTEPNEASFYDFLIWFIDTRNGVFTYDTVANSYKISGAKATAGATKQLAFAEVEAFTVEFPETRRNAAAILNSNTANAAKQDVANTEAVTGVREDFLMRTAVTADVTARKTLETARLLLREHEVVVDYKAWPTTPLVPGSFLNFAHSGFSSELYVKSKEYRVRELTIELVSQKKEGTTETAADSTKYQIDLRHRLELKTEKFVPLPDYVAPRWPVEVEGLIVSEQNPDETWQFTTSSTTSLDEYKVKIPLFANKIVVVPFDPNMFPGHFYFPAYKAERVLLSFEFRSAVIASFLDWRAGARLPQDGQGNHLLLGLKNPTNQTSISHAYVAQKPVLTIKRTKEKDTEMIEVKEGTLTIKVEETK